MKPGRKPNGEYDAEIASKLAATLRHWKSMGKFASWEEISRLACLRPEYVSRIVGGKAVSTLQTYMFLCHAMGHSLSELIEDSCIDLIPEPDRDVPSNLRTKASPV